MFTVLTAALIQFVTFFGQPTQSAIGTSGWGNDVAAIGSSGWSNNVA